MRILYCDCFSGISGDMFLGALLDAGMPVEYLNDRFKQLNLPEYKGLHIEKVNKGSLAAILVSMEIDESHNGDPKDHDHSAHHRHLSDIRSIIEKGNYSPFVQQTSLKIFQKLAEAEAKVHGSSTEEVHFHEVGAVDSILDIVGAAIGLEYFNIDHIVSSPLPFGTGTFETQHGLLPLPAPATLELMRMANAPVIPSNSSVELVTPTGAAILAAVAEFSEPEMKIQQLGIGAGKRDLDWPNVLRVVIGDVLGKEATHLEIETNIDDMNPQIYGNVMGKLFQAGALDVYFTPIFMKKNRPATKLSVIVSKDDEVKICDLILRETSTMGVRVHKVWRVETDRETRLVETRFGQIPLKLKIIDRMIIQASPEFDVCASLAEQSGVPVAEVLQAAVSVGLGFLNQISDL